MSHKPLRASPLLAILFRSVRSMAGKGNVVENPTRSSAIGGQSSGSTVQQDAPKGTDLVSELFKNPDALNLLRNALFAQDPIAADAGALKAHHKAPDLETPATKRPKRGNEHSHEVINVDANPEQAIQGDESLDASNDDDRDINSASRWQASAQLSSFLGTLHKPLSAFERKTICRKFPRPDVDAIYTPTMDAYLSSLVPGVKAADKENKFLQDRLLDSLGPLRVMFEHVQRFLAEEKPGSDITLSYAQMSELGSMACNAMRLVGNSSAVLSKQRRITVLNKINTKGTLVSLASEEFPDAGKNLFGEGFEARIKTRSETAKTLIQASSVGQRSKPFFRGRTTPFRSPGSRWGGANRNSQFQTFPYSNTNPFRGTFRGRGRGSRGFLPAPQTSVNQ